MSYGRILAVVSCYSDFSTLAHQPRGKPAQHSLYTYELDPSDGSLVLQSVNKECENPAFSRYNPENNVFYTCTEFLNKNGELFAYKVNQKNAKLEFLCKQDAGGTSTCYITFDQGCKNVILVNYWDSTVTTFPLDKQGNIGSIKATYDSNEGKKRVVTADKHVNHARNDAAAIKERQSEPHLHGLVLDPVDGKMAFVPDLGMDIIRQFVYKSDSGKFIPCGSIPSGPKEAAPHGPRYFHFHSSLPFGYVVNEVGCNVCVFRLDETARLANINSDGAANEPVLTLVQMISTIPEGYPILLNTCGRISVHPSGNFVLVSNRGHNSITVYRIRKHGEKIGHLETIHYWHSRGETPRHYKFDPSGQWLLVPNQDSNDITVFRFDLSTGRITSTGNKYRVPSPNFCCCFRITETEEEKESVQKKPRVT